MKSILLTLSLVLFSIAFSHAQTGHEIDGTVIDSTKLTIPGSVVTLTTEIKADSTTVATDANGKFAFKTVNGSKITLSVSSLGYQGVRKHFAIANDGKAVVLNPIVLRVEANVLKQVNINGVSPVRFTEDTTEYKASAYKVRDNAPIEDVIKKLPGVDVDVNGNITTQGKQVTKVRLNGKDYMAGDVQSLTKNLPADVVENIQMIDDYGDQAALTGVKTGEPDKIMNITIRADKNYGYSGQGTVGDGEDALPQSQGIPDDNRYIGSLNTYTFNGNQIVAVNGSVNNTNVNTFNFGSASTGNGGGGNFGGGVGGGGGGFGGGGGRGNAARGAAASSSLTTTANGITDAHSIGADFRDEWGKNLSVYGSYSFADNTVNTISTNNQQNISAVNPSLNLQNSNETDRDVNHRLTWNMEWKPDTSDYFKITPTFAYASVNTVDDESVNFSNTNTNTTTSAYTSNSSGNSQSPTYGLNILYNHRFPHRRNLSLYVVLGSTTSNQYQNPVYNYTVGPQTAPDQMIYTYSRTNSISTTLSYLEPLGKFNYLEFNYVFSRAVTTNDKETDASDTTGTSTNPFMTAYFPDSALSNQYNYTFTTNKFALNYIFRNNTYNYVLGLGVQPSELDGFSPQTGNQTHVNDFNVIPTARFVYRFSASHFLAVNYNGSSSSPTFTQLQPVIDFSNALYPVEGNPYLNPQFTNNLSIRYNAFDFSSGNLIFTRLSYQQINDYITTNTITYPSHYLADNRFSNTVFTQYLNTPGDGYSATSGNVTFAKPWDSRKFTLQFFGTVTYSTTVGYLTNVTNTDSVTSKNISKNLQFTPGFKFMTDIPEVIDAQIITSYAINRTTNSVQDSLTNSNSNIRTFSTELIGKNYFGNWTFSYDYSKTINYGYAPDLHVTNPNLLSLYVERRFLKGNRAMLRLSVFDLFNQNTGFSSTQTESSITTTHVNRLARYYLGTFTLRLQKFAGKAPNQDPGMRDFRRNGGPGGFGPGGPGGGGPGGGGHGDF
jgi:uncharacterized membrane protein YgcG